MYVGLLDVISKTSLWFNMKLFDFHLLVAFVLIFKLLLIVNIVFVRLDFQMCFQIT